MSREVPVNSKVKQVSKVNSNLKAGFSFNLNKCCDHLVT